MQPKSRKTKKSPGSEDFSLTKTEMIQALLEKGQSTREIAKEVHCSLRSIDNVKNGIPLRLTTHEKKMLADREDKKIRSAQIELEVKDKLAFDEILIPLIAKKCDVFDSTVQMILQQYQYPYLINRMLPASNNKYSRREYLEKRGL